MNDKQENTLTMFLEVQKFCDEKIAIWGTNVPFKDAYKLFSDQIPVIRAYALLQEIDRKGLAEAKLDKEKLLVKSAIPVSKAVIAYANKVNNPELRQAVDYSKTTLEQSRDTILAGRVQIIHDKANEFIADLAPYGITPVLITTLDTYNSDYQNSIPAPREGIVERKTATENLDASIKATREILKDQLDNLIFAF